MDFISNFHIHDTFKFFDIKPGNTTFVMDDRWSKMVTVGKSSCYVTRGVNKFSDINCLADGIYKIAFDANSFINLY